MGNSLVRTLVTFMVECRTLEKGLSLLHSLRRDLTYLHLSRPGRTGLPTDWVSTGKGRY